MLFDTTPGFCLPAPKPVFTFNRHELSVLEIRGKTVGAAGLSLAHRAIAHRRQDGIAFHRYLQLLARTFGDPPHWIVLLRAIHFSICFGHCPFLKRLQ
jgi:hypothetical protein